MGSINIFKPLSTFFYPAPLINLSNIDNLFSEKNSWMLAGEPGEAESVSIVLCCPHTVIFRPVFRFQDVRQVLHHLSMVKAKDMSDSVDGKFSLSDAKEEADRGKKTSIKIVISFFHLY